MREARLQAHQTVHRPGGAKLGNRRRRTRMSVRERAALALEDDWPQVLAALRRGLADKDAGKAARTAVAYVQLVYGRQLQQPADELPVDPRRLVDDARAAKCIEAPHPRAASSPAAGTNWRYGRERSVNGRLRSRAAWFSPFMGCPLAPVPPRSRATRGSRHPEPALQAVARRGV